MTTYGADSFPGRLSSIMQGSSDSTFYVVALYYGAVSIKDTRYSVGAMLLADLVGIITSILLAYLFFG
jgi:spore maturation protein SpmB